MVYTREDGTRPNSWGVGIDAPENTEKQSGPRAEDYLGLRASEIGLTSLNPVMQQRPPIQQHP